MILSAEVDCKHCQHSRYHDVFAMKITEIMNVTHVQLSMIYAFNRQELARNSPTLTKPSHAKVLLYMLSFSQRSKKMMKKLLMNQVKNRSLTIRQFYLIKT